MPIFKEVDSGGGVSFGARCEDCKTDLSYGNGQHLRATNTKTVAACARFMGWLVTVGQTSILCTCRDCQAKKN